MTHIAWPVGFAISLVAISGCKSSDREPVPRMLPVHDVKLPDKPIVPRPFPPGIPERYDDDKAFSVWGMLKRRAEAERGGFVARVKGYVVETPRCAARVKICARYHLMLADREVPAPGDSRLMVADMPPKDAENPLRGARIVVEGEFRLQSRDYFAAPDGLLSFQKMSIAMSGAPEPGPR